MLREDLPLGELAQLFTGATDVDGRLGYAYYDTSRGGVSLAAGAHIERFEYGILARRIRPDAAAQGLFSLNLALKGTAPSLDTILVYADGHLDFAVWPKSLGSGVFDRWAVNVFRALLPFLDPAPGSQVNCLVGRVDLKDGRLTHDALVIDTTRVRALGAGSADLRTEQIALRFRPRAKGLAFFSLQTPIGVTGTMSDFRVVVRPGDLFEAVSRFFGSVIVVPFEQLIRGPLPRDGADVCSDPLRSR